MAGVDDDDFLEEVAGPTGDGDEAGNGDGGRTLEYLEDPHPQKPQRHGGQLRRLQRRPGRVASQGTSVCRDETPRSSTCGSPCGPVERNRVLINEGALDFKFLSYNGSISSLTISIKNCECGLSYE